VQVLPEQQGPFNLPQDWQLETVMVVLVLVLVAVPVPQARSYVAQPVEVGKVAVGQQGSPELPQVQRPDLQLP
jgi:hypothetical protein